MVIFGRTRGPVGGVVSGGRNPVIPSLLRDKEAGRVKVHTSFIKIVINFNKVKDKVKTFLKIISFFIRNL